MDAPLSPEAPAATAATAVAHAYAWLQLFGFPADVAASSLMPELFALDTVELPPRRWRVSLRQTRRRPLRRYELLR